MVDVVLVFYLLGVCMFIFDLFVGGWKGVWVGLGSFFWGELVGNWLGLVGCGGGVWVEILICLVFKCMF